MSIVNSQSFLKLFFRIKASLTLFTSENPLSSIEVIRFPFLSKDLAWIPSLFDNLNLFVPAKPFFFNLFDRLVICFAVAFVAFFRAEDIIFEVDFFAAFLVFANSLRTAFLADSVFFFKASLPFLSASSCFLALSWASSLCGFAAVRLYVGFGLLFFCARRRTFSGMLLAGRSPREGHFS